MHIQSLDFKGFRGSSFRLKFSIGTSCIYGMNGSGKSTIIDVLAAMTGHTDAKMLIHHEPIEYAKVVVNTGLGPKTLEINGWDWEAIDKFKDSLPVKASYVLQQENLHDDRLVTKRREPIECQTDMLKWLDEHDLGFSRIAFNKAGASMLVSSTGAQVYLLNVGMRRAPSDTPMLVEHPERHLHIVLKRRVVRFLKESALQQAIITSHSPEVLGAIDGKRSSYISSDDDYDCMIGLDQDEYKW